MPRRKAAIKRVTLPDPVYGSVKLSRFINVVMRSGKRSIAERIVYTALEVAASKIQQKTKTKSGEQGSAGVVRTAATSHRSVVSRETLTILERALDNIRPAVEVKSRRVGGATYQVPVEVNVERGIALAMRWIVKVAKGRSEQTMVYRLAAEMLEALEERGASVKIRDDMHRMAKANQAFAHYRW